MAPRMTQPEDQARENIDRMLTKPGWAVRDQTDAHISVHRGLAIRNFTYCDKLFTEIFPGRTEVPTTFIYVKEGSHAEDIVEIVRQEFGKGNDFAQKITYRTTGAKPEQLISDFRNTYFPRIAVTVDMIATDH